VLAASLFAAPALAAGGPDAFGYSWLDSSDVGGPAFSWEITTTALAFVADEAAVSLPWSMPWYGTDAASLTVSVHGHLALDGATAGSANACPLGAGRRWLPWWDEWTEGAGQVTWGVVGTAPSRRLVITWDQVEAGLGNEPATFQLKAFEADGAVEFHYLDVDVITVQSAGERGTIGIDGGAAGGLLLGCDQPILSAGYAVRFEAPCGGGPLAPPCSGDDDDSTSGDDDDSAPGDDDDDSAPGDDDDDSATARRVMTTTAQPATTTTTTAQPATTTTAPGVTTTTARPATTTTAPRATTTT